MQNTFVPQNMQKLSYHSYKLEKKGLGRSRENTIILLEAAVETTNMHSILGYNS